MLIGFVGDVHGRVLTAMAAVATWQRRTGRPFDALIQVGDMGAYPDPQRTDAATQVHLALDPTEADFSRPLHAEGELAGRVRSVRERLAAPIHFLRGNHEDFAFLRGLAVDADAGTAAVDPFDVLRYVPDGCVLTFGDVTFAFLGGAEELSGDAGLYDEPYRSLMERAPGSVDVLVSHQGPHGSSRGYRGDVQGARRISALVEHLQPPFHVAGHAHQLVGPRVFVGETAYLGLAGLVPSVRWQPEARGLSAGCLGVLDSASGALSAATDDWLSEFETPFDFNAWFERFSAGEGPSAT